MYVYVNIRMCIYLYDILFRHLIFYRKIKNEAVGIDVAVPSHDKVSSPKQVKNYHVIVITRLPHFKDATHSENEVVQFTVSLSVLVGGAHLCT